MKTKVYQKPVRDLIPEIIEANSSHFLAVI